MRWVGCFVILELCFVMAWVGCIGRCVWGLLSPIIMHCYRIGGSIGIFILN